MVHKKYRVRDINLDSQDDQLVLVNKVPVIFMVTAWNRLERVNVGDTGTWSFFKHITDSGERIFQVLRVRE